MGKVMPCSVFKGLPHECLAEVQQTVYINKMHPLYWTVPAEDPGILKTPAACLSSKGRDNDSHQRVPLSH